MKPLVRKAKPLAPLLGLLALIVVFTVAPHAFALTAEDDPHGPMESMAWLAAISVAGVMSGIGYLTIVKRGKPHQK